MAQAQREEFPWMVSTPRRRVKGAVEKRWDEELGARAELLARLGFAKAATQTRLEHALAWEYELLGKPGAQKRLHAVVTEAYRVAGVGAEVNATSSRPARRKSQ